ncbi:MAG: hypothetical protein ACRDHL_15110, partial [Candidatus Promineifilaceae bacterium]
MKRTWLFTLLGALLALSLLLVACTAGQPPADETPAEPAGNENAADTPEPAGDTPEPAGEGEAFPDGTPLRILQWSHFVPRYDEWFDPFAQEWGTSRGVDITVDHIDQAQLIATLTAAIDAGEGPDLVELIIAPSLFVEGVHD